MIGRYVRISSTKFDAKRRKPRVNFHKEKFDTRTTFHKKYLKKQIKMCQKSTKIFICREICWTMRDAKMWFEYDCSKLTKKAGWYVISHFCQSDLLPEQYFSFRRVPQNFLTNKQSFVHFVRCWLLFKILYVE